MHSFEYTSPTSKEQVVQLLGSEWSQASVFAGGTDLLALMKDDIETPRRVVNIKSVAGLDTISFAPRAGLKIGALAHLSQIADNADVQRNYPMLAWAVDEAASPQIRNIAISAAISASVRAAGITAVAWDCSRSTRKVNQCSSQVIIATQRSSAMTHAPRCSSAHRPSLLR